MEAFLENLTSMVTLDLNSADCSVPFRKFAAGALPGALTKKLVTAVHRDASKRAYEKFVESNSLCSNYELRVASSWDEELVGIVKDILYKFFNPAGEQLITEPGIISGLRVGPGAALLAEGGSMYEKVFNSTLSYTRPWVRYAITRAFRSTPTGRSALAGRRTLGYTMVDHSKMSFVRKENAIDRVICVEPSCNMMLQLGTARLLEERLKAFFGIDLSRQPDKNRELARQGSLNGTFATIDLSSASDSISLNLLRNILPKDVFDWLSVMRSPNVVIPARVTASGEAEKLRLEMVSTMGNGFTFPLQTILFAAIVRAVYLQYSLPIRNPFDGENGPKRPSRLGNWAVFGDDIIVETKCARRVLYALELFGFRPNPKKTFVEGPFRESCGTDWFEGEPVRAVYIKSLESIADRFVAINQLIQWTARTGIPLPRSTNYLLASVPPVLVPLHEADYAGVRVPSTWLTGSSRAFRALEKIPRRLSMERKSVRQRGWIYNSYGCYLSFLRGEIRDLRLGIREDKPKYKFRRFRVSHNWDMLPACTGDGWLAASPEQRRYLVILANAERQRITSAVCANLGN